MPGRLPLAAILAGGKALRMGADKVRLPLGSRSLIEHVHARVSAVTDRVITVGGGASLGGVEAVPDRYPGMDTMGGIATALWFAREGPVPSEWVLVVGCDMPFLERPLLVNLYGLRKGYDVVVPRIRAGFEPLCALYRTTCMPVFEEELGRANLRIRDVYPRVRTREVGEGELRRWDPELRSFVNVNRPDDLERARLILGEHAETPPEAEGGRC